MVLPQVLVVGPASRHTTVADLVKAAKAKPGEISYGSAGNGSSAHLSAALLKVRGGAKMNHIPFRGNAPALIEVMAGRVDFMFYPMIGVADRVTSKQLKVIGITTKQRHADFPGVPTMAEAGFPGFEDCVGPVGFLAPAGTRRRPWPSSAPRSAPRWPSRRFRRSCARWARWSSAGRQSSTATG